MKIRIILTLILMLNGSAALAQTKTFQWANETCKFEGTYNAKKYTAAQLKDTNRLLRLDFFPNTIDPTPRDIEKIKTLRVETLDAEYAARTNELKRLNIIKTAFWESVRQKYLKELSDVYQLSRASILGYRDPTRLKDVKFAGACVEKYAEPLIKGGDALLTTWRTVHEEKLPQNSAPERLENIFNEQFNSPERMRYAQSEVMAFGWWNCVNALTERQTDNSQIEAEFRKLFIKTKEIECEEL